MNNIDISRIKGIIFDYGGTLDSEGCHWSEVLWKGYAEAGVAVDKGDFRNAYVYAERELARVRHILPEHNFHDMLVIKVRIELQWLAEQGLFAPALVESKGAEIARYCYEFAKNIVAASARVLAKLAVRYPMVLVSNFYGNVESVLEDFGIRRYFRAIVESAVVGVRKPDPRIFELGVEALGLKPQETLVVGDSLRKDIEPAESIGCQALWLKGEGWNAEENARTHPNTIYELSTILKILEPEG